MPACPRGDEYSTLPPPGFADTNVEIKSGQLIDLLKKVIEKVQNEPQFIEQQPKQTDLLVSIAQLTLLSTPISSNDKRDFLNNISTITQTLLTDENNTTIDSCLPSNENVTVLPSDPSTNDNEGDFSLDDLANEYLQNETTPPSSSNDKLPPATSSESEEPDLKNCLSSSPLTPPTNLIFPPPSSEPIIIKPVLESILYSNRLSSSDAADDADCIWKEKSSPLGQMFCLKTDEISKIPTKRISTCIFDHTLYERLTRLIALLPKQCIRNSAPQLSIRPNDQQQHRPQRPNNDNRRPSNRPTFQQNSSQPRYPPTQNSRQYNNQNYPNQQGHQHYSNQQGNPHYSNQQGNPNYPGQQGNPGGGYFVDRRSQQQQQNRYPPPPGYAQNPVDQQQQGPPKKNSYNNGQQQQKKKPQSNNQQPPNQYQQRGNKKGFGDGNNGNKPPNDKSGANTNPK